VRRHFITDRQTLEDLNFVFPRALPATALTMHLRDVRHPGILFARLPTLLRNGEPRYTHRLEEGITDDRHGMTIIRNEGILEMLE